MEIVTYTHEFNYTGRFSQSNSCICYERFKSQSYWSHLLTEITLKEKCRDEGMGM